MGLPEYSCVALILLLNVAVVYPLSTRYGCNQVCSNLTSTANVSGLCEQCCDDCCTNKKSTCTTFFYNGIYGCHEGTGTGVVSGRGQVGEMGVFLNCSSVNLACPATCTLEGIPPSSNTNPGIPAPTYANGSTPPVVNISGVARYQLNPGDMVTIMSPNYGYGCQFPASCNIVWKFYIPTGAQTYTTTGAINIANCPTSSIQIGGVAQCQNTTTFSNTTFTSTSAPAGVLNYKLVSNGVAQSGNGFFFKITAS